MLSQCSPAQCQLPAHQFILIPVFFPLFTSQQIAEGPCQTIRWIRHVLNVAVLSAYFAPSQGVLRLWRSHFAITPQVALYAQTQSFIHQIAQRYRRLTHVTAPWFGAKVTRLHADALLADLASLLPAPCYCVVCSRVIDERWAVTRRTGLWLV